MQASNSYSLLKRFSRNILFTVFDFLCTETVFLSVSVINKLFHQKVLDYILVSQTIQVNSRHVSALSLFRHVANMTIHCVNQKVRSAVFFPSSLEHLKIYGDLDNSLALSNFPENLKSFQITSIVNSSHVNLLYLPSLRNGTLKRLKVVKSNLVDVNEIYSHLQQPLEDVTLSNPFDISEQNTMHLSRTQLKSLNFYGLTTENFNISDVSSLSSFKSLTKLHINPFFLYQDPSVLNSLPNLTSLKFSSSSIQSTLQNHLYFLQNCTCKLSKLRTAIYLKYGEPLNKLLFELLGKFENLMTLKLCVYELNENEVSSLADFVINWCKTMNQLEKFNGIPVKALEFSNLASITIYEDLFISPIPSKKNLDSDLTMAILEKYKNQLGSLYEIRIKPKRSAVICIYLEKVRTKIRKFGFFTDNLNYFKYPMFSFLIVLCALRKDPEFQYLRLQTMYKSRFFMQTLNESLYLKGYEGPNCKEYLEIFSNLPNFDTFSTSNLKPSDADFSENLPKALKSLTIKNSDISILSKPLLKAPINLESLQLINIAVDSTVLIHFFTYLKNLKNLKSLSFSIVRFSQTDLLNLISCIGEVKQLQKLDFYGILKVENDEQSAKLVSIVNETLHSLKNLIEVSIGVMKGNHIHLEKFFAMLRQHLYTHPEIRKIYGISPNEFTFQYFLKIS